MILITGSTGLVGRHLLLSLIESGKPVRALYRSEHKKEEVLAYYAFAKAETHTHLIEWALGDITDIPTLSAVFTGVTHVYHCAALISFDPYRFDELTKVNVEGTANVVNLSLSTGVEKLVHLSSIATLASTPNNPITEENYWDPDAKNSVYALTKNGAEMEVWRGTEEGLNAVIFNPGVIIGEGDYTSGSGKLFSYILKKKSYFPTGSTGIIDVKDLVSLMISAMNGSIKQERYIAVGHTVSYKLLFSKIATVLNLKPPSKPLSTVILKVVNTLDMVRGVFVKKRQITSIGYKSLQTESRYRNDKLCSTFNYTPTALTATLDRVAKHLNH
ncbi:NAD-dependent epimerase/dehydratase family protein [Dokdonia donghaensis]|uniref:NAD-dependent epimerase/dehydratase domain-containing protein n=1 Tax=Dokdonia donghaensis DSW-1 TaxID=1300343 RepID=A0A0A2GVD3_9FLAO|nr:NAD-dependent epimerase/dehydratase family protein [Dokdonia donghaensis]ANH59877.1 3 beta-hydroxysteroid dehydrogenase/Delta 5-->4-isomerase [Dokdonia donghaensis DSW-1]KGO07202.1 hypothetical protein NV36_10390 [Dokdonia donghaensis DSW-1]